MLSVDDEDEVYNILGYIDSVFLYANTASVPLKLQKLAIQIICINEYSYLLSLIILDSRMFVILEKVRQPVDAFLSLSHSGFRSGRSCADVVWAH